MLATSERVRPCSARFSRSSSGRVITRSSPSRATVMVSGASCSSVPFGPFTVTRLPEIVTSTPLGTGMGILPIRDISSPHLTEDLAADTLLTRLAVGHETLVRRENRDPHAAEYARDALGLGVDAQAGLRHAA